MKLFKKLGLVLALGASLVLVACGGDNPNETTSSSDNPTCKSTANWAKISKGLTESKVLSILGSPAQITSAGNSKTYIYERCRGFLVTKTREDPNTVEIELVEEYQYFGGSIVFSSAVSGFVASFASPARPTELNVELAPNQF